MSELGSARAKCDGSRSRTWRLGFVLALSAAIGLASGCSAPASGKAAVDPPPTTAAETSAAPDPTPTPTPAEPQAGDAISGTALITDADGYAFSVKYKYVPQAVEKEIASEKPGFTSLVVNLNAEFTVVNTTPGRDIAFRSNVSDQVAKISLVGLWPSTSAACTYSAQGTATDGPKTCGVVLAQLYLPSTLGAGQTIASPVYAGRPGNAAGLAHVPDAEVAAVTTLLGHPESYIIAYSGDDAQRFANTCPNPDLKFYIDHMMFPDVSDYMNYNDGYMPIFSPSGNCSSNYFTLPPPAS